MEPVYKPIAVMDVEFKVGLRRFFYSGVKSLEKIETKNRVKLEFQDGTAVLIPFENCTELIVTPRTI